MMAGAALAMYAVWIVLAFGLRAVLQLRRTGDHGVRGLSGRPGSIEWSAGLLFILALVCGAAAPAADLLGLVPIGALDHSFIGLAGLVLALVGVGATLAAQLDMGDSWRVGVDPTESTSLVMRGAFRIVRNPIFSAMCLTAAGLTAMVPNLVSLLGLLGLLVALELQVRWVEEPYLVSTHGSAYVRYGAEVGRFVPNIGRLQP